jgi:hypothetical protein
MFPPADGDSATAYLSCVPLDALCKEGAPVPTETPEKSSAEPFGPESPTDAPRQKRLGRTLM